MVFFGVSPTYLTMAQRVFIRSLQQRLLGTAASTPKVTAKPDCFGEIQVETASNGVRVAAQENGSSLARIVCAVKAGSRYEHASQRGASHMLRASTDLTQRETRAFYLTKSIQQMGGNITCTSSREHLIYTLEVPRNLALDALPFLSGMVCSQSFRPWEIGDIVPRLEYEISALAEQPDRRVVESLHYAAYREGSLGRSIYAPAFQLRELSSDLLREYVNTNYTADRISVSAAGMEINDVLSFATSLKVETGTGAPESPCHYYGGETREPSEDLLAYTVLASEGSSASGDDLMAFAVLEQLLGAGPQIRWASNTSTNKLNSAITKKTTEPFHAQAFNVNYSDSGLFGVSTVTVPSTSAVVIHSVMEQLNELASRAVNDETLQGAKNRVKSLVAFQAECFSDAVQSRAVDLLNQSEIRSLDSTLKSVDAVDNSAVQKMASKVLAGKLSMSSVGEIHNVPYLDQLK